CYRVGLFLQGADLRLSIEVEDLTKEDNQALAASLKGAVDALAIMPAWVRPLDPSRLHTYATLRTRDYTVTSYPAMARQVVAGVPPGGGPARIAFRGLRRFHLDVRPWRTGD
ncbi:hypothetical protein KKA85_06970, partial [bacterium]|nr:hypothetical protein [bacterium]